MMSSLSVEVALASPLKYYITTRLWCQKFRRKAFNMIIFQFSSSIAKVKLLTFNLSHQLLLFSLWITNPLLSIQMISWNSYQSNQILFCLGDWHLLFIYYRRCLFTLCVWLTIYKQKIFTHLTCQHPLGLEERCCNLWKNCFFAEANLESCVNLSSRLGLAKRRVHCLFFSYDVSSILRSNSESQAMQGSCILAAHFHSIPLRDSFLYLSFCRRERVMAGYNSVRVDLSCD